MLTLVRVPARATSTDPSLVADFVTYERRRAERKPWLAVCFGFAVLIALGAQIGDFPLGQAAVGAALCLLPLAGMLATDAVGRRRLLKRLDRVRKAEPCVRKS